VTQEDERLRALADQIAETRIIRDARKVDVAKYADFPDAHLLRSPEAFRDDIIELFESPGCRGDLAPWPRFKEKLQFRPHETTAWVGYSASFKTTLLMELMTSLACRKIRVAIASLEMPAKITLVQAIRQASAIPSPSVGTIDYALAVLAKGMVIYDVTGSVKPRMLIAVMNYCALELGIKHFMLDNLSAFLSVDNDKSGMTQQFIGDAISVARTTGMHVHMVAHCKKPEHSDESRIPNRHDLIGTSMVTNLVDNVNIIWRDRNKEEDPGAGSGRGDIVVKVDKQKHWGFEGMIPMWRHAQVARFTDEQLSGVSPFLPKKASDENT